MNAAWRRTSIVLTLGAVACSGAAHDDSASTDCGPPFTVEGEPVCLDQGIGSHAGNRVSLDETYSGDLNGDGLEDRAVVLVHDSDGSGVFYYLSVVLASRDGGWHSAGDAFLGDRIDVDSIGIDSAGTAPPLQVDRSRASAVLLVVRYRTRSSGEPMSTRPSVDTRARWRVTNSGLVPAP